MIPPEGKVIDTINDLHRTIPSVEEDLTIAFQIYESADVEYKDDHIPADDERNRSG